MSETVKSYVKKPVEVKALQWTGENIASASVFTKGATYRTECPETLHIEKPGGYVPVLVGDFIIHDEQKGFSSCTADIFYETYEPVSTSNDDNVTKLGEVAENALMISPEQALEKALSDIRDPKVDVQGNKALVILLDDSNDGYTTWFFQAGMSMSQCIALCEVGKSVFLNRMNY